MWLNLTTNADQIGLPTRIGNESTFCPTTKMTIPTATDSRLQFNNTHAMILNWSSARTRLYLIRAEIIIMRQSDTIGNFRL